VKKRSRRGENLGDSMSVREVATIRHDTGLLLVKIDQFSPFALSYTSPNGGEVTAQTKRSWFQIAQELIRETDDSAKMLSLSLELEDALADDTIGQRLENDSLARQDNPRPDASRNLQSPH
jgi:hypothetical protein